MMKAIASVEDSGVLVKAESEHCAEGGQKTH